MNVPIKRGTARRLSIIRPLPPGVYWAPLPGPRGIAAMDVPIKRGTARRLGLRHQWRRGERRVILDTNESLHWTNYGWKPAEDVKPLSEEEQADFMRWFADAVRTPFVPRWLKL